jgi:hypothetical protein
MLCGFSFTYLTTMRIKNIDGLSAEDLQQEVQRGAKFVFFPFTVSVLVVTFKQTSGVYLVRAGEKMITRGFPFLLISFLFGWWGIPFGPKFTIEAIRSCLRGGKDVTDEVMATVAGFVLFREKENRHMATGNK